MSKRSEPIPGITDIFPEETTEWRFLENTARDVFRKYGYDEIRTPILEREDVFLHSIGESTDIVQKEMYSFTDRGGRNLTLRPEGTAGVLRALTNRGILQGEEKRVYYSGAMFRGERPATGRKRQFHQLGVENVGKISPDIDVECIVMLMDYFRAVGLSDAKLLINTRGLPSDRDTVSKVLSSYFSKYDEEMCSDCRRRLDTNIWRILDCKNPTCREIIVKSPPVLDNLSESSRDYFRKVCDRLRLLNVEFEVDTRLVRGLDYYVHTVFELVHGGCGAQNAVAGGGRYEIMPPGNRRATPGVGFAIGLERLILSRADAGKYVETETPIDVYLVSLGDAARLENLVLAGRLRENGVAILMDLEERGMKAQMRSADKSGARFALIRGDEELSKGVLVCKNMGDSNQFEILEDNIITELFN